MTDIVESLRTESGVNYPEGKYLAEIMADAADEIDRLRAEIGHLREIVHAGVDEIERLRGILRDIERALATFSVESEP